MAPKKVTPKAPVLPGDNAPGAEKTEVDVTILPTLNAPLPKNRQANFYSGDGKTTYECTVKCFHSLQLFQAGDTVVLPLRETLPEDYFRKV